MDLEQFCSASRVIVVAGKGGVGKTTVAATLAVAAARTGMSVLVVAVEGGTELAACFDRGPIGHEDTELAPRIRARTLAADRTLLEYLEDHGLRRVGRRLASSGVLDVVTSAVPGMRDIVVLGKVKAMERDDPADLIVLDTPAAGHAITFLLSPRGLLDAVRVGPIRRQATEVVEMLSDAARCRVLLVTIPESTPVNEVIETAYALEDRVGVKLGPVVVNQCEDTSPELDGVFVSAATAADVAGDAARAGLTVSALDVAAMTSAAVRRHARGQRAAFERARLAERLALPQLALPRVTTTRLGLAELEVLADQLTDEVIALDDADAAQ